MTLRERIAALVYFCQYDLDPLIATNDDPKKLLLLWRALSAWPTSLTNEQLPTAELVLEVFESLVGDSAKLPTPGRLNLSQKVPSELERDNQRRQAEEDLKASGNSVPNTISEAKNRIREAIRQAEAKRSGK